MHTKILSAFAAILAAFSSWGALAADDQAATNEARLRQALRDTMLQLRDAQNQVVTLQASQAQSDRDNADLKAKVEALNAQITKLGEQAASDKAASDQAIADLTHGTESLVAGMVDTLTTQINFLGQPSEEGKARSALEKAIAEMKAQKPALVKPLDQYETDIQLWATGYSQYVQLANKTEAERARLSVQANLLQRVVADRETKNIALFKVGNEILTRYEKFSLGDALAAKEPFIGVTRVQLENLVQGYKDKLLDQTVVSGQPPSPVPDKTKVVSSSPPKSE